MPHLRDSAIHCSKSGGVRTSFGGHAYGHAALIFIAQLAERWAETSKGDCEKNSRSKNLRTVRHPYKLDFEIQLDILTIRRGLCLGLI